VTRRASIKAEPLAPAQVPEGGLSVGYLMARARASLLAGLDAELAPFGLNAMQYAVLKHLADGNARTAADLCRHMYYDTGSMTRILDRLEEELEEIERRIFVVDGEPRWDGSVPEAEFLRRILA